MEKKTRILSCGHSPSEHGEHTTGTAWTPDNKEICYDCAFEGTKEAMKQSGKCFEYLSGDGKAVITWPGNIISDKIYLGRTYKDNFGGERTPLRFEFDGKIWAGFAMGKGMYLRARATKLTSLYA